MGRFYYRIARGEDERLVVPNRVRKSISVETSYDPDLSDLRSIEQALAQLVEELHERLARLTVRGYTLTLKVKFSDYIQVTRSVTQTDIWDDPALIQAAAMRLLSELDLEGKALRLLGLGVGKLVSDQEDFQQLALRL